MRFKQQVEVKTRTKGAGGHQAFQAEVVPNETLSGDALYERLAERSNLTPSMARIYVDTLQGFIVEQIAKGNRLDFDLMTFYPRLSGGLSSRDADPASDGVYVRGAVKARRALMEAPRRTVEAVNKLSNVRPRIYGVTDTADPKSKCIAPGHELLISGCDIPIVTSRPDEGVWLETRRRGTVAVAEVLESSATSVRCVFHEIPPSDWKYTLVVGTRCGKGTDFKVRRCLADVRVA